MKIRLLTTLRLLSSGQTGYAGDEHDVDEEEAKAHIAQGSAEAVDDRKLYVGKAEKSNAK